MAALPPSLALRLLQEQMKRAQPQPQVLSPTMAGLNPLAQATQVVAKSQPQPAQPAPAPGAAPVNPGQPAPAWLTGADKQSYDASNQGAVNAENDVTAQEQRMASTPDFQVTPPTLKQENPWAMVGQALAGLLVPRVAPGVLASVEQFQQQASDQYQRDLQSQQLQREAYDSDFANQTRRLTALQGIAADREKQRNDLLKNFLTKDRNDQAFYVAMTRAGDLRQQFEENLTFKYKHDQEWAQNNKAALAEKYANLRNQYQIAGMRTSEAQYAAEIRVRADAAKALLGARVNEDRIKAQTLTGKARLDMQQRIAAARNAESRIDALSRSIDSTYSAMSRAINPQVQQQLHAQMQGLITQRGQVEAQVKKALGGDTFSLAPLSDSLSNDATGIAAQEQQADLASEYGQYYGAALPSGGATAAPNITVNPTIKVDTGGGSTPSASTATQPGVPASQPQFKGYRHRADVIRVGAKKGLSPEDSIKDAQAHGYQVVP